MNEDKLREQNAFGGGNPHGLYVPITETEQETISRLVESKDLEVVVHGWGVVNNPRIIFGDHRLSVHLTLRFSAPEVPQSVHYFDLELRTRAGLSLIKQRQPTQVGGRPIEVAAGVNLSMIWDIGLHHLDPKVVKCIKPGAIGLTSRRFDRDTGDPSFTGNMRLDTYQKKLLAHLEEGEKEMARDDAKKLSLVTSRTT